MENKIENKQKLFAQYWGQTVFNNGLTGDNAGWFFTGSNHDEIETCDFMVLKPLSSISDEDAIEVIKTCEGFIDEDMEFLDRTGDCIASPKKWRQVFYVNGGGTKEERTVIVANFSDSKDGVSIYNGNEYWRCHIKALDYLRSKGYALPYMGLTVEKQIEYGWVKLSTDAK